MQFLVQIPDRADPVSERPRAGGHQNTADPGKALLNSIDITASGHDWGISSRLSRAADTRARVIVICCSQLHEAQRTAESSYRAGWNSL
jgi:hypothetical protein